MSVTRVRNWSICYSNLICPITFTVFQCGLYIAYQCSETIIKHSHKYYLLWLYSGCAQPRICSKIPFDFISHVLRKVNLWKCWKRQYNSIISGGYFTESKFFIFLHGVPIKAPSMKKNRIVPGLLLQTLRYFLEPAPSVANISHILC